MWKSMEAFSPRSTLGVCRALNPIPLRLNLRKAFEPLLEKYKAERTRALLRVVVPGNGR